MATYKVIQDIEAEDKLIGPLTLRQFIYGCICAICLYLSFLVLTKHAAVLVILFLPVALLSGFFAFPWKSSQPTEVWALAKVRFLFKPRRRIWDQSGIKELVQITAPKLVQDGLIDPLTQTEVKSRLTALADLIDTRGWAIKNVTPGTFSPVGTDRLVDITTTPVIVPSVDIQASDDLLDEVNNPVALHLEQMITASTQAHRQQIRQELLDTTDPSSSSTIAPNNDYWFLNQPKPQNLTQGNKIFGQPVVVGPGTVVNQTYIDSSKANLEERALTEQLKSQQTESDMVNSNLHVLSRFPAPSPRAAVTPSVTPVTDPAILGFAARDDLNISTLSRQVNHQSDDGSDEVIVNLH
jgi:hypothetical protein